MRSRPVLTVAAAGAALLALAGCTAQPAADPIAVHLASAAKDYGVMKTPTWSVTASIVGEPVADDGVVAAYTRSGSKLQVQAWNAKTGKELWHDAAVPGGVAGGIELSLNVVHEGGVAYATYLHRVDADFQRVVARRLTSGKKAHVDSASLYAESRPSACVDGKAICIDAYQASDLGSGLRHLRLGLDGTPVTADADVTPPAGGFMLDDRVFAVSTGKHSDDVGYVKGGLVLWRKSYSAAFAKGYLPSNGWAYLDAKQAPVVVGTASTAWTVHHGKTKHDLAKELTVGLRRTDGAVVWRKPGMSACGFAGFDSTVMTKVVTLCGFTGARSGAKTTVKTAEVLGVDIATGRTLWHRALAARTSTLDGPFLASNAAVRVLPLASGPRLVDLATGTTRTAPAKGVYACTKDRKVLTAKVPHSTRKQGIRTGSAVFACELDQSSTGSSKLSTEALRTVGVAAGSGVHVIATTSGLSAYRV